MKPLLVSSRWLQAHIGDISLRLFDVSHRMQPKSIRGAAYCNPRLFYSISPREVKEVFIQQGFHHNSYVILYSNDDPEIFRAFFVLTYFGFQISILWQGLREWVAESFETQTQYIKHLQLQHFLIAPRPELVLQSEFVATLLHTLRQGVDIYAIKYSEYVLVDCTEDNLLKPALHISPVDICPDRSLKFADPLIVAMRFRERNIDFSKHIVLCDEGSGDRFFIYFLMNVAGLATKAGGVSVEWTDHL